MPQAEHVLIVGPSGGGKTTHARKMYAEHDGPAIWINHNDETIPADGRVTGIGQLRDAIESDPRARVDYRPTVQGPGSATIPVRVAAENPNDETLVVGDEASHIMPEGADRTDNPLAWAFHEGRDSRIKAVAITQDPTELAYPPIKSVKHIVWAGPNKTFHRGFRQFYNIDPDQLPDEDHHYHVIRPTDPPEVIHTGKTDPNYS